MIEYQFPLSPMDAARLMLAHLRSAVWDEELHPRKPRALGSASSGNFGHAGRPGEVGGSAPTSVLPEKFYELADLQRGAPERAMEEAQSMMGGGVMSVAVEHMGDLIHRMTERNTFNSAGYVSVKEKVNLLDRSLNNPYGFKKEFNENIAHNAFYHQEDPEIFNAAPVGFGLDYEELRNPKTDSGKQMTEMLKKLPIHDGVTYRGVALEGDEITRLVSAKGYELKLHSSSSQDENVAAAFTQQVYGNKETPVLMELHGRGRDINAHLSEELHPTKEVVLMAGTRYRFAGLSHEQRYGQDLVRIKLQEVR